jgi:glutamate decarboxylase
VPQQVKKQLYKWQASKRLSEPEKREVRKKIGKVNHIINALNIKLHKALRLDDTTFVSRTTLESTRYRPQHITVLRSCLINPLTDRSILEEIVKTQNRLGMELWPEFEPAYLKALNGVRKTFAGGRGEQEQGRWAL